MMIIDAHLHITDGFHGCTGTGATTSLNYGRVQQGNAQLQLLPPFNPGPTVFPPETVLRLMDLAGVDAAVLLQGSFYGDHNRYLYQAAKRWPDRLIPTGYLDPCAKDARDQFHRITDEYGFRILKFEMTQPAGFTGVYPDLRLDGSEMLWIWEEAERRGLVVTLDLGKGRTPAYQTDAVQKILELHPTLTVVIAHLAQPALANPLDKELDRLWEQQILLGRHANVWFDTSALPAYCDEDYPFRSARLYLKRAAKLIGADKLMWGTDIPGLLGQATYEQLLNMIRCHTEFTPAELDGLLGGTAEHVYLKER